MIEAVVQERLSRRLGERRASEAAGLWLEGLNDSKVRYIGFVTFVEGSNAHFTMKAYPDQYMRP